MQMNNLVRQVARVLALVATVIALSATLPPAAAQTADAVKAGAVRARQAGAPASAGAGGAPYRIAVGHPRIFINDPETRARLSQVQGGFSQAGGRFMQIVNTQMSGRRVYGFQPWYAALLSQLTGNASYCKFAVEQTESFVLEEEARIARGQRPAVAGDSYLEVGIHIGNLALVYDWCHGELEPAQRARWIAYGNQAVWNVWNHSAARWGGASHPWSGWSVDNPSNNYYYSFMRATMLLGLATHGENPQADAWIRQFRQAKMEGELIPTFNRDLAGGGSREGTGYGTAMRDLWRLYEWWERSTGERLADRSPHTRASLAAFMHSVVPTLDRLAPTGDHARDASAALFDYHRDYLLGLMMLYPQDRLAGIAASLLANSSVPQMKQSFMYFSDFLYEQPALQALPLSQLSTAYWAPGTGQITMRGSWERDAAYASLVCGPYSESHAHRDQGSFVLFRGDWLVHDANVHSRSGIEQDEEMHNLVRIEQGGSTIKQGYNNACQVAALADTASFAYVLMKVTPIYRGKPAVAKVEREFLFIKPDVFVVFDRVATQGPARRIFTLNFPAAPTLDGERLSYAAASGRLDVLRLAPANASAKLVDWTATRQSMRGGVRVDVPHEDGGQSLFLHVLATGGAVRSAARSDVAGMTGAQLALADGRSVVVRFSNGGTGGTLELRAADGTQQFGGALPTAVTAPPLFAN